MAIEFRPGDRLCSCTLLEKCGVGAYGEVWLAEDGIGSRVALKIISGRYSERELAGLKNCRDCNHPNLLKIRHVELFDDRVCYTMDAADDLNRGAGSYLPDTLANRLDRSGRLEGGKIAGMLDGLLAGLEELHGRGLVHRDIKPDNILWVNGRPTLSDVGLVVAAGKHSLVGTPGFISPRMLESGGVAGPSDDFYALSKVIYCALTGLPVSEYPEIPENMTISIAPGLNRALLAGCSGPVGSTAEFRRIVAGKEPSGKPPEVPPPVAVSERSRFPERPAWLTLVLALVVAGIVFWLVRTEWLARARMRESRENLAAALAEPGLSDLDRKDEFLRDRTARAKVWFRRFGMLDGALLPELLTRRVFARKDIEPELDRRLGDRMSHQLFRLKLRKFPAPDAAGIAERQKYWRAQSGKPADIAYRMLTEDPVMQAAAVNMLLERFCRLALEKREFAGQIEENADALIELQNDFIDPDFGFVKYLGKIQKNRMENRRSATKTDFSGE